jgi:hypothetical protein
VVVVRHALRDPVYGAIWQQDELRGDDLVVMRKGQRGAAVDEAIAPERVTGWSAVRFVLDGPLVARAADRAVDVRPGDLLLSRAFGDAPARALEDRCESLTLVWRSDSRIGASLAHNDVLRPSPLARLSLLRLAGVLAVAPAPMVRSAAFDAIDALRSAGLPFETDGRRGVVDATDGERAIARALERVLFPLSSQPMAIDLARALGVCPRHALRCVNGYFRRYYRLASSWREYVRGMRVMLGAFFIGQPSAATERIARLLGFGSATALCHAFRDAGLPSPLAVQRALLKG